MASRPKKSTWDVYGEEDVKSRIKEFVVTEVKSHGPLRLVAYGSAAVSVLSFLLSIVFWSGRLSLIGGLFALVWLLSSVIYDIS